MDGARFTRRARLKDKTAYQRVFERPVRSGDRYFTVLARCNDRDGPRLGLAISRKTAKAAVARNRIKRVIRESFRVHQRCLGGLDVVVIGRPKLADVENHRLFESLRRHWSTLLKRCAKETEPSSTTPPKPADARNPAGQRDTVPSRVLPKTDR